MMDQLLKEDALARRLYPTQLFSPDLLAAIRLIPTEYVFFYYNQEFNPRTVGDREHSSEIISQLRSRLSSLTRMISYCVASRGNTSPKRRHNSAMEASLL